MIEFSDIEYSALLLTKLITKQVTSKRNDTDSGTMKNYLSDFFYMTK